VNKGVDRTLDCGANFSLPAFGFELQEVP